MPISELPEFFVRKCLGDQEGNPREKDVAYLLGLMAQQGQKVAPTEKLQQYVDEKVPAAEAPGFMKMINQVTNFVTQKAIKQVLESIGESNTSESAPHPPQSTTPPSRAAPTPSDAPAAKRQKTKKTKEGGKEDLNERHNLVDLRTTEEKVRLLLRLEPKLPKAKKRDLTGGARKFF